MLTESGKRANFGYDKSTAFPETISVSFQPFSNSMERFINTKLHSVAARHMATQTELSTLPH